MNARRAACHCTGMRQLSSLVVVCALALGFGCGSKEPEPAKPMPPPTQQGSPEPVATLTAEQCTQQGGEVRGDIGDGKIACGAGERELGKVPVGTEGSICCAPSTP